MPTASRSPRVAASRPCVVAPRLHGLRAPSLGFALGLYFTLSFTLALGLSLVSACKMDNPAFGLPGDSDETGESDSEATLTGAS